LIQNYNTHELRTLFERTDKKLTTHNLKVSQQIFNRHLRKEILNSPQLKDKDTSKLTYLNTLKCSSLRFCNKGLALRLRM
jgi:hypothetical protein